MPHKNQTKASQITYSTITTTTKTYNKKHKLLRYLKEKKSKANIKKLTMRKCKKDIHLNIAYIMYRAAKTCWSSDVAMY